MKEYYQRKLEEALAKAKEASEAGDYEQFVYWNREAENYRKMTN